MASQYVDEFVLISGASMVFIFVQLYLDVRRGRTTLSSAVTDFLIFAVAAVIFTYALLKLKLVQADPDDASL